MVRISSNSCPVGEKKHTARPNAQKLTLTSSLRVHKVSRLAGSARFGTGGGAVSLTAGVAGRAQPFVVVCIGLVVAQGTGVTEGALVPGVAGTSPVPFASAGTLAFPVPGAQLAGGVAL